MFMKDSAGRHPEGVWQYQEAKAKLSQVMDQVQDTGMQIIIRNRDEVFVVLSKERFDECSRQGNSLVDFFLEAPCPEVDLDITRSQESVREIDL